MVKKEKNANYDFSKQKEPTKRMGTGYFANMPDGPMLKEFSKNHQIRSGVINSFVADIREVSDISENQR